MGSLPILRRISTFRIAEYTIGSSALDIQLASANNTNLLFTGAVFGLSLLGASYSG
jgi:hypothetical protein